MGCGKSTAAKCLGRKTGCQVLDTDQLLVEKTGRSIADIFAADGEVFFRQLESETLEDLFAVENAIIATGGGIIEKSENWPLLRKLGKTFFLDVPWPELQHRIAAGTGRPLAGDSVNWETAQRLWERRLPLYRQADISIDTAQKSIDDVVAEILRRNNEG